MILILPLKLIQLIISLGSEHNFKAAIKMRHE